MKKIVTLVLTATILTACATRSQSIPASYVSHEKYVRTNCAGLETKMSKTRAELDKFSKMQNNKANVDAFTVFIALVPVSKLAGDSEADVARLKGEVEAIETAQIKAGCVVS